MQEYDRNNELINTVMAESEEELINARAKELDGRYVVIGNLPGRGEIVTIHGLKFKVLSKSDKRGTLHLEILKPERTTI